MIEIRPELVCIIKERNVRIPYLDIWPSEELHRVMYGTELPCAYKKNDESMTSLEKMSNEINKIHVINNYPIDNVWLSIVNIGKYAVNHLEVYGEYYFPFIRLGDSIDLILTLDAYPRDTETFKVSNGIDRINNSNSTVKILDVRKERIDEEGSHIDKPKQYDCIWIDFEDIDGNGYRQTFRTHPSGVGNYYCNDELIRQ